MNYLHSLNPPVQWRAGFVGDEPFYFSCGDCGAQAPVIHGIIANEEVIETLDISKVCLLGTTKTDGGIRMAMFCSECYQTRVGGKPPRAWNPPPPKTWPELSHHCPTRTCARSRIAVFAEKLQDEKWDHWRTWDEHTARLKRSLTRVLVRHLEKGGTIVECDSTEWSVKPTGYKTPQSLADHIVNRVVGFGWSVALKQP